jgi:hypothetical protein
MNIFTVLFAALWVCALSCRCSSAITATEALCFAGDTHDINDH